jgi:uncharacterized protein
LKRLLLLALFGSAIAVAEVPVPPLKARITDLAAALSAQQSAALEQALADFERRKGVQLAVLIVPTTQPETVEQYAVRVEEAWKLGRKGVDDGVLLLVAKNDRRLRIEVGYGLEGVLPDAIANRIIEEDITPHFKQGDFYGGIRAGTERIMRVVEGEKLPPPAAATPRDDSLLRTFFGSILESAGGFIFVLAIGLVLFVMGAAQELLGRALGSLAGGGIIGAIAWLMSGLVGVGIVAGIIAVVLSVIDAIPTKRSRGSGSWCSSGRGSSGGGGGFSGGGGGSGGGGSSGSW